MSGGPVLPKCDIVTERERERVVTELDWIRLGLGFVCFGEPGYEDRTFIYRY